MKKNLLMTVLGAAALGALASCSTPMQKIPVKDLTGEWTITAVDGKDVTVPEGQEAPYIGFDTANGNIFGYTGCNRLRGHISEGASTGEIMITDVASTRMMCPDIELEQSIISSLGEVALVGREESGDVKLCNAEGKGLLTLRRQVPSISAATLEGEWFIKEIEGTPVNAADSTDYVIHFDTPSKSFSFKAGCNIIGGTYVSDYIDIRLEPMTATTMECPDTETEQKLVSVLPTITSFSELADGSIGFYNNTGNPVLIISRQ